MRAKIIEGDYLQAIQSLPAECVDTIVTSPPYYAAIDYGHFGQIGLEKDPSDYIDKIVLGFSGLHRVCTDDAVAFIVINDTRVTNFSNARESSFWSSKGKGVVWPRNSGAYPPNTMKRNKWGVPLRALLAIPQRLMLALHDIGWHLKAEIVWDKETNRVINSLSPVRSHEIVLVVCRNTKRRVSGNSMIRLPSRGNESSHPASFPVALAVNLLERVKCNTVLDLFMGHGTVGVACASMGINFIGIDINSDYCNSARRRIGMDEGVVFDAEGDVLP